MTQAPLSVVKVAEPIDILIRDTRPEDAEEIHRIYAFSVMNGTGSFDETPPTLAEMKAKLDDLTARNLPFLVAEYRGKIVGFCYGAPFRPRSAYRYTLEDSVYVASDVRGLGVGRALISALVNRAKALGYRQMVAVIGDSENHGSIKAHAAAGFVHAGILRQVGLKFGQWLDVVFMQCVLNTEDSLPPNEANARTPI